MYNKSLDTASIESMRKALAEVEVNESDRAKHYKGATPPEDMKNNRKGKGAQDMMKPADDAVANPAADEQDMVNKDAAKMTANVKVAKKRRNDKDVGDKDIVEPGTPMKDPAVVKPPVKEAMGYGKPKPGQKVKKEDMDNKMFVLRKQAQLNQRRIDKGMKPYTPLHPDHKNLIKPMKKKKANEEKEMVNIKPRWILDAYKEMYEDVDSGKAQHMLAQNERKAHADHMKKTHGVTTKFHGSDELSYHGTKQQVRKALDNHYGKGGDQKEFHPHIYEENLDELSMNKLGQYRDLAKADIKRQKAIAKIKPNRDAPAERKLKKRKGYKDLAKAKMSYKAQTDKSLEPRGPGSDKYTDYDRKGYAMRPSGPNIKKQMAVTHHAALGDYQKGMTPAKKK